MCFICGFLAVSFPFFDKEREEMKTNIKNDCYMTAVFSLMVSI